MTEPSSSGLVRGGLEGSGESGERERERERAYRKGVWSLEETMVLLEAKKLDDERRMRGGDKERGKTAELRWKWVENYCFKNGCIRSQNQCNDKWDNLLRDYKKVREYETHLSHGQPSYWHLEKHQRKERGLPSNLLYQVYEALHEVVDKRYVPRATPPPPPPLPLPPPHPHPQIPKHHHFPQPSIIRHHPHPHPHSSLPLHQATPDRQHHTHPESGGASAEISEGSESEGSDLPYSQSHSPAKRRRMWRSINELAPAMYKCTEELTQTLMACEEKKDKRHLDILNVEERRLHIEETKTEISREGITGLIAAVNNLATAILTLASEKAGTAD